MPSVAEIAEFLESFAPKALAEGWDNVGLLLGEEAVDVQRVMTCLTLTRDVADEAIRENATLVVTHHPILFRPIQRMTTQTSEGAMLLGLTKAGVAVHSPHTAFDSTSDGVNDRICRRLGLGNVRPIRPFDPPRSYPERSDRDVMGAGRIGELSAPVSFSDLANRILTAFDLSSLDAVPSHGEVVRVAVACGAAAEFLDDAVREECDVLITGEARFHAALEARTRKIGLVLMGHYASERFAVEELATLISERFPTLVAWPSRDEQDPLKNYRPETR